MTLIVSKKGSVAIPIELRRRYRLRPGTAVSVVDYGGGLLTLVPRLDKPSDGPPACSRAWNR